MTMQIALFLLVIFTSVLGILITGWVKRTNTRAERITTVQARQIEQIQQLAKKNETQLWCMIDGECMPFEEAAKSKRIKVKVRYGTCKDENPGLRGRELDVN